MVLPSCPSRIDNYDQLYRYRIVAVKGAHYHPQFDRDNKMNKEMAVHEEPLIKMLLAGRIDLIVDWEIPFVYILKEMGLHHRIAPSDRTTGSHHRIRAFDLTLSDIVDDKNPHLPVSFMAFSRKSAMLKHKPRFETLLQTMV